VKTILTAHIRLVLTRVTISAILQELMEVFASMIALYAMKMKLVK
jgi:hypothetical protein